MAVTDELKAAAELVLADPPFCRCGKPGCRREAAVAVARAYLAGGAGAGLGDEEYGRAWARQQGIRPRRLPDIWQWFVTDRSGSPDAAAELPKYVAFALPGTGYYESEAAAYAALGKAVREVHA